jgi:hypothetical protein
MSDYLDFLSERNGGEGWIGSHYLHVFAAEVLARNNRELKVDEFAPGLLFFGGDGGGGGYAFDTRDQSMPIVSVELCGMDLNDVRREAATFTELLEQLAR